MTHSPGPWRIQHDEMCGYIYNVEILDANGETVADDGEWPVSVCDMPLIAAAPELLEALETLYSAALCGAEFDISAACARAAEVIVKAGGQP